MKKKDREYYQQFVGRAFRGADGLVRWIRNLSVRGYFSVNWLDETRDVWFDGGIYKADRFPLENEVPAPRVGDTFKLGGAMGLIEEYTIK